MVFYMDKCSIEQLETVAQLKKAQIEDIPRLPLGPSEKHNAEPIALRPPSREVASRYKSGITGRSNTSTVAPRRCPSPDTSRNFATPTPRASIPKRVKSAERRRPSTPSLRSSDTATPSRPYVCPSMSSMPTTPVQDSTIEMHKSSKRFITAMTPDGLWPSTRSLSSSFQAESVSSSVGRDSLLVCASADQVLKSAANKLTERRKSPSRGKNTSDHVENSKPMGNSYVKLVDKKIWPGVMVASSSLAKSRDTDDNVSPSTTLQIPSRGVSPRRMPISIGLQQSRNEVVQRASVDSNGRGKQNTCLSLNTSSHPSGRALSATHPVRTQSSPLPGLRRLPSPSRTLSTPSSTSKVMQSPPRARPSNPFSSSNFRTSRTSVAPTVINYIVDARKGKNNTNHIDDVHQLRLLYNRFLQWRFVNAQALDALFIQKIRAENMIYSVWNTITDLRDSVIFKRINVQHLREEMNLNVILKEQISYLEEWDALEMEHSNSVSGAIKALKASTLRLPVAGGARADVNAVKHAISSALDVVQAMGSATRSLLSKVEDSKMLVSELVAVAAKERAMLYECRELLASVAEMQVQDSSLRTQLMQLKQTGRKVL